MTTRRDFLSKSAAGLAMMAFSSRSWGGHATDPSDRFSTKNPFFYGLFPIMQGWTTETATEFKIMRPLLQRPIYSVVDSNNNLQSITILEEFCFAPVPDFSIDHIQVVGLRLGETYRLQIHDDSCLLDEREFTALDLSTRTSRFALLSCMHDSFVKSQRQMWRVVVKSRPNLLIFTGDTCYADHGSKGRPKDIWRRFCETRATLEVFRTKRLIPTLAIWDDHDYGMDNAGIDFPYKLDSLRIFKAFFGSASTDRLHHGPGVSQIAYGFGLRFGLMDDRYYRTPQRATKGAHWGEEQEASLQTHLAEAALPTFLCDGAQFFGRYLGKGSFEGDHVEAFERLKKNLRQVESPIVFCSGDVHFSEIMTIEHSALGYKTWELTSSSMHSMTFPGQQFRANNPRRMNSTSQHNFFLIETEPDSESSDGLRIRVQSLGKTEVCFKFEDVLRRS